MCPCMEPDGADTPDASQHPPATADSTAYTDGSESIPSETSETQENRLEPDDGSASGSDDTHPEETSQSIEEMLLEFDD